MATDPKVTTVPFKDLGAIFGEYEEELADLAGQWDVDGDDPSDLGATLMSPKTTRLRATLARRGNQMAQMAQKMATVQTNPAVKAAFNYFAQGTKTLSQVAAVGTTARVQAALYNEMRPSALAIVNIDGLTTTATSGIATVASPYGATWALLGWIVNSGAAGGLIPIRCINYTVAGVQQLTTSNVTWSSGSPTSPGMSLSLFDARRFQMSGLTGAKGDYNPWVLASMGAILDATQNIQLTFYNPSGGTLSAEMMGLLKGSPCGTEALTKSKLTRQGYLIPGTPEYSAGLAQMRGSYGSYA